MKWIRNVALAACWLAGTALGFAQTGPPSRPQPRPRPVEDVQPTRPQPRPRAVEPVGRPTPRPLTVEQRIDGLFLQLDTNKDGRISRAEAQGSPLADVFDRIDPDREGFLDQDKLLRAEAIVLSLQERAPAEKPAVERPTTRPRVERPATQRPTLDVIKGPETAQTPRPAANKSPGEAGPDPAQLGLLKIKIKAFLKQFDTNGDLRIDKQEFKEAFGRLDENEDGFLDKQDLHQAVQLLTPSAERPSTEKTSADRPAEDRPAEGKESSALDFRIFTFVKEFDANKDRQLDLDETVAMFGRIDRDKDGLLDSDELLAAALLAWPPVGDPAPSPKPPVDRPPAQGTLVQKGPSVEQIVNAILVGADTDKDGRIDQAELKVMSAQLDLNKDNGLDRDELLRFAEFLAQGGKAPASAAAPPEDGLTVEERVGTILNQLDASKDGSISRAEARGSLFEKVFERIDLNKDGLLSKDEMLRDAAQFYPSGKAPAGQQPPQQPVRIPPSGVSPSGQTPPTPPLRTPPSGISPSGQTPPVRVAPSGVGPAGERRPNPPVRTPPPEDDPGGERRPNPPARIPR